MAAEEGFDGSSDKTMADINKAIPGEDTADKNQSKPLIHDPANGQTFTIQRTRIPRTASVFSLVVSRPLVEISSRVLSVYRKNKQGGDDFLEFYIDLDANPDWSIWPLSRSQRICAYTADTKLEDIVERVARPINTVTPWHQAFGRFMCTVGGIREAVRDRQQVEIDHESAESHSSKPESSLPDDVIISSGLGHGTWYDSQLERVLDMPRKKDTKEGRDVRWKAFDKPVKYVSPDLVEFEWKDRGPVKGGGLMLKSDGGRLAIYKARSAEWNNPDDVCNFSEASGPTGVLVVLRGDLSEEMRRHIVLCAVGIEEQIMASKGFDGSKYHAGW